MSMPLGKQLKTFEERVRVETSGCHVWVGKIDVHGYGKLMVDGAEVIASRYAWERAHGEIPAGLCVLHRCDNPPCVNPEHLFLGTRTDNMADKVAKGRGKGPPKGNINAARKLTADDVKKIRSQPSLHYTDVAAQFGISKTMAHDILRGKTWRSVQC